MANRDNVMSFRETKLERPFLSGELHSLLYASEDFSQCFFEGHSALLLHQDFTATTLTKP